MSSPTVHISLVSVTLAKHRASTYFSFYRFWHWTFIMRTKHLNTLFHEAILPHWRYTFYPFLLVYSWPTLILLGSLGPVISYIFFTVHIKEGCRSRNQRNQSSRCSVYEFQLSRLPWNDMIKAMSPGISGGKQVINVAITSNRGLVCFLIFSKWLRRSVYPCKWYKCTVLVSTSFMSLLFTVRTSTATTASKKHWSLPPIIFLNIILLLFLSWRSKLERHFLYWQILLLVFPLRNQVTLLLYRQFLRSCKDDGYRE